MSTSESDVGRRFQRPLTADEISEVERVTRSEGGAAGFTAMWSLIWLEAEGVTWDEATERGLKFYPNAYAIAIAQTNELLALMTRYRGRHDKPVNVSMTWLNGGPASYVESASDG